MNAIGGMHHSTQKISQFQSIKLSPKLTLFFNSLNVNSYLSNVDCQEGVVKILCNVHVALGNTGMCDTLFHLA